MHLAVSDHRREGRLRRMRELRLIVAMHARVPGAAGYALCVINLTHRGCLPVGIWAIYPYESFVVQSRVESTVRGAPKEVGMDIRRNTVENREPAQELRTDRDPYPDIEVPDEVEAWDLDDMDMMDLVPDPYE